jgi:hypothetical protein
VKKRKGCSRRDALKGGLLGALGMLIGRKALARTEKQSGPEKPKIEIPIETVEGKSATSPYKRWITPNIRPPAHWVTIADQTVDPDSPITEQLHSAQRDTFGSQHICHGGTSCTGYYIF